MQSERAHVMTTVHVWLIFCGICRQHLAHRVQLGRLGVLLGRVFPCAAQRGCFRADYKRAERILSTVSYNRWGPVFSQALARKGFTGRVNMVGVMDLLREILVLGKSVLFPPDVPAAMPNVTNEEVVNPPDEGATAFPAQAVMKTGAGR